MKTEIRSCTQPPPADIFHSIRPSTTCNRHPNEPVIGFCASCLRDRLESIAKSTAPDAPLNSAASKLNSILSLSSSVQPHSSSSRQPELRRSKSFSVSQIPGFAAHCEPRRKSCDVRARNTLLSLFHQDDSNHPPLEILDECPKFPVPDEMNDVRIKDHIDIDTRAKKISPKEAKEFAGSFWLAASVFSKKLQNWRKQKVDKKTPSAMPPEKIAIDAFGRRFSLDGSRFSFEDPRCSWDEPRASLDGYLIGGRVGRFDGLMPVEEDAVIPGGSSQTRDYYDGPSSCGRRSLQHSNSNRKLSFEFDLQIQAGNAKGSPTMSGGKHERDSREWSSNSLRDEYSENIELSFRHQSKVPPAKKSRRLSKAWSFLGFIHRRVGNSSSRGNGVERSLSETWPELGADEYNRRICRSNSSVSSRSSFNANSGFGSWRGDGLESNGNRKKKKKREEVVLERNHSSRYSPRHVNNGLLRFYLPAMKGSRRSKYSSPHSIAGSMLRLY